MNPGAQGYRSFAYPRTYTIKTKFKDNAGAQDFTIV